MSIIKNLDKDHPIKILQQKIVKEMNNHIEEWMDDAELSEEDTQTAIANALLAQSAHFFAGICRAPKDEFMAVSAEYFRIFENKYKEKIQ